MLGDHTYEVLRRQAAIAHAVPGATLTIAADGAPVLVVGHDVPDRLAGVRTCSPCGFRSAVGRAHALHGQGRQMSLLGLGAGARIAVDFDPGSTGDVIDGDIVLAWIGDRLVALTATTLRPAAAARALSDAGIETGLLSCHDDELLGATLLHLDVPVADPVATSDALDLLGRVRDACAVSELLDALIPAEANG